MPDVKQMLAFLQQEEIPFTYEGDTALQVDAVCPLHTPREGAMTWIKDVDALDPAALPPDATLLIVAKKRPAIEGRRKSYIVCENPKHVFFVLVRKFFEKAAPRGISPKAVVETSAYGSDLSVGALSYIASDVVLGDRVTVFPNATILGPAKIGNDVIIHSGVVIGDDGFGVYQDTDGRNGKVPHLGGVCIGDRAEIGTNSCVDKGTLNDTVIEDDVKIDNLCQIAHNVTLRKNCNITAGATLAGSCTIGENTQVGPGSSIMNQITIGKDCLLGLGAVAIKDIPDNKVAAGVPAAILRDNKATP